MAAKGQKLTVEEKMKFIETQTEETALSALRELTLKNGCEYSCAIGPDGKVLDLVEGGKDENGRDVVRVPEIVDKAEPNSIILCHSHPDNTCFSIDDLNILCGYTAIKEMRVIGKNGKTYTLSVGEGKRPTADDLANTYKSIGADIYKPIGMKLEAKEITWEDAMAQLSIGIVERMVDECKWIKRWPTP